MPTYAIGDIHGCNRTFKALLKRLSLRAGDVLVLLGDLIDRGPDSKGVIDTVWRLQDRGFQVVCLRGNHEQLLLEALTDPQRREGWLFNGGRQTLDSFGVNRPEDIPTPYMNFFHGMPYWYETKGYLCVHGGLDFSSPDPLDHPETMLWIRRWYNQINYEWLAGRTVLHGHTPEEFDIIKAQHQNLLSKQYLNLDNGCVYALLGRGGQAMGSLLALCLDHPGKLYCQINVE